MLLFFLALALVPCACWPFSCRPWQEVDITPWGSDGRDRVARHPCLPRLVYCWHIVSCKLSSVCAGYCPQGLGCDWGYVARLIDKGPRGMANYPSCVHADGWSGFVGLLCDWNVDCWVKHSKGVESRKWTSMDEYRPEYRPYISTNRISYSRILP